MPTNERHDELIRHHRALNRPDRKFKEFGANFVLIRLILTQFVNKEPFLSTDILISLQNYVTSPNGSRVSICQNAKFAHG